MHNERAPLHERVPRPGELRLPEGPAGIRWRALSVGDTEVVTELAERISNRDHPTWSESLDEIREELGHSWVDSARDGVIAFDAAGTAVAWATVSAPPGGDTVVRVFVQGGVAKNAPFADHWGSQPTSREQWESMQHPPSFRPDLSRIARAGDDVVGFVITEINEDDWERQGSRSAYIGLVGTVREWRGRGLASALLAEVLQTYRTADLELAVLDVDTESPTGALGVYTRLGFAPTTRDVAYRVVY